MENNERKVFTVSQVGVYIKSLLEGNINLKNIYIKGEISNFVHHKAGHLYFDIKDEGAALNAIMFAGSAKNLKFAPENGMMIIAGGRISSYEKGSRYQIIVNSLEPDGIGALYIAYEQLKQKLKAEGLFDISHKKPIPKIPSRVGVITSPTGAAVRDIITTSRRRFPYAEIVLYPSLVQGDGAAANIVEGLRYFNTRNDVDVIIAGRGGGSIEDLWAFNEEPVAREIYASRIPVISAVGHETDFTIADMVADLRAPTPTAAAELALPNTPELMHKFNNITDKLRTLLTARFSLSRQTVKRLAESRALSSPMNTIDDRRIFLASVYDRLDTKMKFYISSKKNEFVKYTSALESLNPMSVISRGYSAVYGSDGNIIKSVKQTQKGEKIKFRLTDGEVAATVDEVKENEN